MADTLHPGDEVAWATPQGQTHGTVTRRITGPAKAGRHEAKASPHDPQFEAQSDKTGAKAIHRPQALTLVKPKKPRAG